MPKPSSESIYLMTTIPQLTARDYVARLKKQLDWYKGFSSGLHEQNDELRAQIESLQDEANTLKSAFEEAHARCEALEYENEQLKSALDNMAVVIRTLLDQKEV